MALWKAQDQLLQTSKEAPGQQVFLVIYETTPGAALTGIANLEASQIVDKTHRL